MIKLSGKIKKKCETAVFGNFEKSFQKALTEVPVNV